MTPQPGSPVSYRGQQHGVRDRLRQLAWASVPLWSLGMLAFAPFLRLALARHRARDWAVFAAYAAAVTVEIVLFSVSGTEGGAADLAGAAAIALMGFAAVHAFAAYRPGSGLPPVARAPVAERPNAMAMQTARSRITRRHEARELARKDPVLARELRIGRPDLPHDYDDGGLVDVNHVPGDALTAHLGLTPEEASAVVAARDQLGQFGSPEELSAYAGLEPQRVDELRDMMWFG